MNTVCAASIAGSLATLPMTGTMVALHRMLPPEEQYPLPPREITMNVAEVSGAGAPKSEDQQHELTLVAHYAYGAAAGAGYAIVAGVPGPAVLKGIGYGLGVWAISYLGWLPAVGLLPSATEQPQGRNAVMIAAHVVWGAALGVVTDALSKSRRDY